MFKEFFELDKDTVENWLKKDYMDQCSRNGTPFDTKHKRLIVNYYPFDNEIRVDELLIFDKNYWEGNDEKVIYDGKELTLVDYLKESFAHEHYSFQEVYAKITGKTVFENYIHCLDHPNAIGYSFYYNKENIVVIQDGDKFYISEWNDAENKENQIPLPEDLLEEVKKIAASDNVETTTSYSFVFDS